MNVDKNSLDKVRQMISDLDMYEKALRIIQVNYDSKIQAKISSFYNENTKQPVSMAIPLPPDIQNSIEDYISSKIEDIKKELKSI